MPQIKWEKETWNEVPVDSSFQRRLVQKNEIYEGEVNLTQEHSWNCVSVHVCRRAVVHMHVSRFPLPSSACSNKPLQVRNHFSLLLLSYEEKQWNIYIIM